MSADFESFVCIICGILFVFCIPILIIAAGVKMSEVFLTREEIEHPYANLAVMLEDKRKKAEQMKNTVFHRITQSPEVLAEKLVYLECIDRMWHSTIFPYPENPCPTREAAIAATVAKLKEIDNE